MIALVGDKHNILRPATLLGHSQDLMYVKTNSTINQDFLEKWANCLVERQQLQQKTQLSISEFFKQFPIFETNDRFVFDLLIKDVKRLYSSYSGIQPWDNFYKNVFTKLQSCRDEPAQKFLTYADDLNEGTHT